MPEELILECGIPEINSTERFDFSGANPGDVAYACAFASEKAELPAFQYSGIDLKRADALLAPLSGKGAPAAAKALNSVSSGLRASLSEAAGKPTLLPAAEAYFFGKFLEKFGIPAKLPSALLKSSIKPKSSPPKKRIGLMARYGDWISIKKLGLDAGVPKWEISGMLAGITETLVPKAFQFAEFGKESIAEAAEKAAMGKRKSYGAIAEVLSAVPPSLSEMQTSYFLFTALSALGPKPYANRGMLTKEYPDIKPPKPRGRQAKG